MESEKAARLARGLQKNALLPELIDARANEIREAWEEETDSAARELHWIELKTLNDLKDFIYARLRELSEREQRE